jgi:hypothetical protein
MTTIRKKIRNIAWALFLGLAGYAPCQDLPLANTRTLGMEGVRILSIQYGADDVFIRESETGDIILKEYMPQDRSRYYAKISRSGETLTIRQGRRPWFRWSWKARAELYLPRSFREHIRMSIASGVFRAETDLLGYKTIDVSVSSGFLVCRRLSAETISARLSSGDLDITGIEGNSFMSVSSGRMRIGDVSGPEHRIKTSSGRILIGAIRGNGEIKLSSGGITIEEAQGRMDISIASGSIGVGGFSGEGSFDLSSGDLRLDMRELQGDLRLNVTSGIIQVNLPRASSFNLDAVTNSGRIWVDEGGKELIRTSGNSTVLRPIGASPERTIYARTRSGNVTINVGN